MENYNYKTTNNELSLLEIINFFEESWKKILLGGVVGGALCASYSFQSPNIFEATANIQISKLASPDNLATSSFIEKFKIPTFYSNKNFIACEVENIDNPGLFLAKNINVTLDKSATIISLTLKGKSRELLKKCIESIVTEARQNQENLLKPIIEKNTNRLVILQKKLESSEKFRNLVQLKLNNFDSSESKSLITYLILLINLNNGNDLELQITDLKSLLYELQVNSIFLTAPIYISEMYRNHTLITLGGSIAGIIFIIFFLMIRKAWLNMLN